MAILSHQTIIKYYWNAAKKFTLGFMPQRLARTCEVLELEAEK